MGTKRGEPLRFIEAALSFEDRISCLIWPFSRSGTTGYGRFYYAAGTDDAGRKIFGERDVHPFVCERVHGPKPSPEHEAAYSCDRGREGCINPHHVRWATPKENGEDRVAHGKSRRGIANGFGKLTDEDVRKIRAGAGKVPRKELARRFGIGYWYVRNIQKRRARSLVE